MATVQHPQFENTKRVVDDPADWVEQGWLVVPDEDARDSVYEAPADVTGSAPAESPKPEADEKSARPKPTAPDKK